MRLVLRPAVEIQPRLDRALSAPQPLGAAPVEPRRRVGGEIAGRRRRGARRARAARQRDLGGLGRRRRRIARLAWRHVAHRGAPERALFRARMPPRHR
jgi:hypothetical protein